MAEAEDDEQLGFALDLIRGEKTDPAYPPKDVPLPPVPLPPLSS